MHSFLKKHLFEYSVCCLESFPEQLQDLEVSHDSPPDSSKVFAVLMDFSEACITVALCSSSDSHKFQGWCFWEEINYPESIFSQNLVEPCVSNLIHVRIFSLSSVGLENQSFLASKQPIWAFRYVSSTGYATERNTKLKFWSLRWPWHIYWTLNGKRLWRSSFKITFFQVSPFHFSYNKYLNTKTN